MRLSTREAMSSNSPSSASAVGVRSRSAALASLPPARAAVVAGSATTSIPINSAEEYHSNCYRGGGDLLQGGGTAGKRGHHGGNSFQVKHIGQYTQRLMVGLDKVVGTIPFARRLRLGVANNGNSIRVAAALLAALFIIAIIIVLLTGRGTSGGVGGNSLSRPHDKGRSNNAASSSLLEDERSVNTKKTYGDDDEIADDLNALLGSVRRGRLREGGIGVPTAAADGGGRSVEHAAVVDKGGGAASPTAKHFPPLRKDDHQGKAADVVPISNRAPVMITTPTAAGMASNHKALGKEPQPPAASAYTSADGAAKNVDRAAAAARGSNSSGAGSSGTQDSFWALLLGRSATSTRGGGVVVGGTNDGDRQVPNKQQQVPHHTAALWATYLMGDAYVSYARGGEGGTSEAASSEWDYYSTTTGGSSDGGGSSGTPTCKGSTSKDTGGATNLVGNAHPTVPPRFHFNNVFTSPLPLADVQSGAGGAVGFAPMAGTYTRIEGGGEGGGGVLKDPAVPTITDDRHSVYATNKIMRLYKGIHASKVDGGASNTASGASSVSPLSSSAFFALMDEGRYTLHPMRVGVGDYLFQGEHEDTHHHGNGTATGSTRTAAPPLLRGGPLGYWSEHRPILKELLQRYQTFHHEGMRRLRRAGQLRQGHGGGHQHEKDHEGEGSSHQTSSSSSSLTDADYAQFVVVRPVGQLCNRLVAITSAFVFALMTRRVLLIDDAEFYASSDDLFFQPGFEWILRGMDVAGVFDGFDEKPMEKGPANANAAGNTPSSATSNSPQLPSFLQQAELATAYESVPTRPGGVGGGGSRPRGDTNEKNKKVRSPQQQSIRAVYGHAPPSSSSSGQPSPYYDGAGGGGGGGVYSQPPLSAIEEAYGVGLRSYTIQNPEEGVWSETDRLLCSEDYRTTYKSSSGVGGTDGGDAVGGDDNNRGGRGNAHAQQQQTPRPSVVSFTVNQYLVPYYYRNPYYYEALREVFGGGISGSSSLSSDAKPGSKRSSTTMESILTARDDIFSPIAHFLFRPIPSLMQKRDDYIRQHFFDDVRIPSSSGAADANVPPTSTTTIVKHPSYVVGLQVRSGGDFTSNFMTEADWELYRDCGLQTSPPDVLLPSYAYPIVRGKGEAGGAGGGGRPTMAETPRFLKRNGVSSGGAASASGGSNVGVSIGHHGRKFKFFVATDTEKGRQAARRHLCEYPSAVAVGDTVGRRQQYPNANAAAGEVVGAAEGDGSNNIPILFGPGEFKLSNNPDGVRAALLDLLLLAAADDRVQTAWSSFGYFASGIAGVDGNIVVNRAPPPLVPDGGGGAVTSMGSSSSSSPSSCWSGVDSKDLSLLHLETLARHRKGISSTTGVKDEEASFAKENAKVVIAGVQCHPPLDDSKQPQQQSQRLQCHLPINVDEGRSGSPLLTVGLGGFSSSSPSAEVGGHQLLWGVAVAPSSGMERSILQSPRRGDGGGDGGNGGGAGGAEAPPHHNRNNHYPNSILSSGGTSSSSNTRTSEQRFMGIMHKSDKRAQCVRMPTHEPCFHKFESWGASTARCYDWGRMTFPEMLRRGRYC